MGFWNENALVGGKGAIVRGCYLDDFRVRVRRYEA